MVVVEVRMYLVTMISLLTQLVERGWSIEVLVWLTLVYYSGSEDVIEQNDINGNWISREVFFLRISRRWSIEVLVLVTNVYCSGRSDINGDSTSRGWSIEVMMSFFGYYVSGLYAVILLC